MTIPQILERLTLALVEAGQTCGEELLPQRGQRIPEERNQEGLRVARRWLETGLVPSSPQECADLFPHLWAAKTHLLNAQVHGVPPEIAGREKELVGAVMLTRWEEIGRVMWEKPKPIHPWGG